MGRHVPGPTIGRHRYGSPGLVYCAELEPIRGRLSLHRPSLLSLFRDQSRHTMATLVRTGVRPRPAFVLIASM